MKKQLDYSWTKKEKRALKALLLDDNDASGIIGSTAWQDLTCKHRNKSTLSATFIRLNNLRIARRKKTKHDAVAISSSSIFVFQLDIRRCCLSVGIFLHWNSTIPVSAQI